MRAQCGSVWPSVWLCAAAALSSLFAQAGAQTGNLARPVSVGRFETAPIIDGKLDEPAWREAASLRDFHQTQPGDNTAPSYPTTILRPEHLVIARELLFHALHLRAREGGLRHAGLARPWAVSAGLDAAPRNVFVCRLQR
jgi:hypothetical protein